MITLTSTTLKNWTILIVDDEVDSLDVATYLFNFYGANVLTAENGEQGLQLAHEHHPLFILSDLSMPQVSGWDMIAKLKQDPTTADIPVIALTAYAMQGDRDKTISAGFHNYISKPITPETLCAMFLVALLGGVGVRTPRAESDPPGVGVTTISTASAISRLRVAVAPQPSTVAS